MKKVILLLGLFATPLFIHAQVLGNITEILNAIKNIVSNLIPIIFALILIYFFWGLAKFVLNSGDEDARTNGRQMMIWGLVALFVASAVWGLTKFIGDAIGVDNVDSVDVPSIN